MSESKPTIGHVTPLAGIGEPLPLEGPFFVKGTAAAQQDEPCCNDLHHRVDTKTLQCKHCGAQFSEVRR